MKVLFITIFFLLVSNSLAQTKTLILPKPTQLSTPGNIKLLPGYVHKVEKGIDTSVGTISKEGGIRIYYDIGFLAGNYAMGAYSREKTNVVWFKNQKVNNLNLLIVYLKDGNIYATFGESTNFMSVVKTNEELADFLMMIMTYGSDEKPKETKKKQ